MIQCAISEDQEKYIDHAIDREGDRKGSASFPLGWKLPIGRQWKCTCELHG